jgi:hypothetical protein
METAASPRSPIKTGCRSGLRVTSDSADETFDLKGVMGFGVETAANLFESIIQTVADEL